MEHALLTGTRLDGEHNFYLTSSASNRQGYFVLVTVKHEVKAGSANREVSQLDPFQKRWEDWTHKPHEASSPIDL